MRLVERESDFKKLVLRHFEELPPQQQSIAEYLLEHLREAPFLSVPELARRAGASEATVVRFAQRIGYSGFSSLKMDLMEAVRERVAPRGGDGGAGELFAQAPEGVDDTLASVARQEIANIQRTLQDLEPDVFQRVASVVFKADHVFTFGLGISAHMAEVASYLFLQIGLRSTTLTTRCSSPLEQLVALRPSDLLFVFSFPPYSRQTLDMVQRVQDRGIPSVAVCDRLTAPVATLARHVLPVRSDNMMFTNSFAAVSVLLNALVTEIALRYRDHAVEAVSQINHILSEDDQLIEGKG